MKKLTPLVRQVGKKMSLEFLAFMCQVICFANFVNLMLICRYLQRSLAVQSPCEKHGKTLCCTLSLRVSYTLIINYHLPQIHVSIFCHYLFVLAMHIMEMGYTLYMFSIPAAPCTLNNSVSHL